MVCNEPDLTGRDWMPGITEKDPSRRPRLSHEGAEYQEEAQRHGSCRRLYREPLQGWMAHWRTERFEDYEKKRKSAGRLLSGPPDRDRGRNAPPPLPHHRTYGSVYGGSIGYAIAPRPMTEAQTKREKHSTGRCSEPDSDLHATGRAGSQRCSPPGPCSRPAAPVPHTSCGWSSTAARMRFVCASGSTNPAFATPKGSHRNRNSLASPADTGPTPPSLSPCSAPGSYA